MSGPVTGTTSPARSAPTQAAILITAPGGPDVLQPRTVPMPVPGDDEVVIAVEAAGINRHDCNQRRRGPSPAHSDVPGLEVAGRIVAVGRKVPAVRLGEAVCALVDGGGYAAFALAKAAQTLPQPIGVDAITAAAIPEAAFTVWHNLFRLAALAAGESVLLHGGTSGVGSFAIPLLTALGHPVFATCGDADKCAVARRRGAVAAYDYRQDDFVAGVKAATGGRGVDVILDMSGARHTARDVEMLARHGRLLHLSPGDGTEFRAPLRTIMAKSLRVTGSLLRPLPDDEKALIAAELRRVVWPLIEAGRVRPLLHATFAWPDAAGAHRMLETGSVIGKLVLTTAGAQGGGTAGGGTSGGGSHGGGTTDGAS